MKGRNIYCDESMHLVSQPGPVSWGAIAVPRAKAREYMRELTRLKLQFGMSKSNELKWVNVRRGKLDVYKKFIDFFFDHDDLCLRLVVLRDKSILNHEGFGQTHDEWYYKMYFLLLSHMIDSDRETRVFLDEKDTRGSEKTKKLHDVLCNNEYDFNHKLIRYVQEVKSHEVEFLSIVDIFLGAVNYLIRGLQSSPSKMELIRHIQNRSGLSLLKKTFSAAHKVNIFYWKDEDVRCV